MKWDYQICHTSRFHLTGLIFIRLAVAIIMMTITTIGRVIITIERVAITIKRIIMMTTTRKEIIILIHTSHATPHHVLPHADLRHRLVSLAAPVTPVRLRLAAHHVELRHHVAHPVHAQSM